MEREARAGLISYNPLQLDVLEGLYWICCIDSRDLVEFDPQVRELLKTKLITAMYFLCFDWDLETEAQEVITSADKTEFLNRRLDKVTTKRFKLK